MTTPPAVTRRDLLRLAAVTAAAGCTGNARRPSASPSSSGPPSSTAAPGPSRTALPGLAALSSRLSSPLLLPGSAGYLAAVGLYNLRFDGASQPRAIAACRTPEDVAACVRFAGDGGGPLHLRAGGHSYGGWSSGPGVVVDVRPMSGVTVDTGAHTVRIGAGARLAQVYEALARKGTAIAAGSCPTVGITGLTLGGGVGVLTRAFGLTCDAVRSVQLVTADGVLREVDATHDPDLLWALRGGGGGSFGAVTALTLQVRPAPTVHTFFLSWDGAHAAEVLSAWQSWAATRDPQLWSTCKLLAAPGRTGLRAVVAGTWLGAASALDPQLTALVREAGAAARSRSTRTLDYGRAMQLEAGCEGQDAQQCLDTSLAATYRRPFAATSAILAGPLPPAGVAAAVAGARRSLELPSLVEGGVSFDVLGGAVDEVAPTATAFGHRGAFATAQYTAVWARGVTATAPYDAYVRGQRAGLLPWTGSGAYVNYADPSIGNYGTAYWGANYPRLREVKKRYDPAGLFAFPQAVQ